MSLMRIAIVSFLILLGLISGGAFGYYGYTQWDPMVQSGNWTWWVWTLMAAMILFFVLALIMFFVL